MKGLPIRRRERCGGSTYGYFDAYFATIAYLRVL